MRTAGDIGDANPAQFASRLRSWLALLGWVLLIVWAAWWAVSLAKMILLGGQFTWVYRWNFLGLDFYHNYLAVNHWLGGGNPYREQFGDPLKQLWAYPPIVLWTFAWCGLLGDDAATRVWVVCCAAMFVVAGVACARVRRELGLTPIPTVLCVALLLLASPVIFAMERGQFDVLPLMLIIAAAAAVRRGGRLGDSRWGDVVAGVAIALGAYLKSYPLLILPVFLLWRRPWVIAWCLAACVVLGLAFFPGNLTSYRTQQRLSRDVNPFPHWYGYSLTGSWIYLTRGTRLGRIPGLAVAGAVLLPLAGWVVWHLRRTADAVTRKPDDRLLLPALLLFTAVTTFALPVSSDYKLIFLACAALAVWDARDPWYVHVLLAAWMVHVQPFHLPLTVWPLLALKVAGLFGVGLSLAWKARRLGNGAEALTPEGARGRSTDVAVPSIT